jgi:hypothetical protein
MKIQAFLIVFLASISTYASDLAIEADPLDKRPNFCSFYPVFAIHDTLRAMRAAEFCVRWNHVVPFTSTSQYSDCVEFSSLNCKQKSS